MIRNTGDEAMKTKKQWRIPRLNPLSGDSTDGATIMEGPKMNVGIEMNRTWNPMTGGVGGNEDNTMYENTGPS